MRHVEAIVLAGGEGSRFGGGKLLAPYRGEPLLHGALRAALAAPVARIILATGHDAENVGAAAKALAVREHAGGMLEVVHAARHRDGVAETLKAGVVALSNEAEGAFVFLGDMPEIPAALPRRLVEGIGGRSVAAPVFRGERGHPVLFAARFFPALRQLSGDQGARSLLDDLTDDILLIEADDAGVLFDVDRRSDLQP